MNYNELETYKRKSKPFNKPAIAHLDIKNCQGKKQMTYLNPNDTVKLTLCDTESTPIPKRVTYIWDGWKFKKI